MDNHVNPLTNGNIFYSLVKFALPVLLALFLQTLYGAVDLWVMGKFAATPDISGVATGSQLLHTMTTAITSLSMGITVLVGRRIGEESYDEAGRSVGAGVFLFTFIGVILSISMVVFASPITSLLQAPEEAFAQTLIYIRICGVGAIFIVAYNIIGAIFRGLGDSTTPLITVAIAAVINVVLDLILVGIVGMGSSGAALATVVSQAISVLISLIYIRHIKLPFTFRSNYICFNKPVIGMELKLGIPIFLQDFLVGISFIALQVIANTLGVNESAGVGISERVIVFLMLIPIAYMQSMSAFVAQNMGARKPDRSIKAMKICIVTSFIFGLLMASMAIFRGDVLAGIFTDDPDVIYAAKTYLMSYGLDCLLTPILFGFVGFFNGCEKTLFVMIQGIIGSVVLRLPMAVIFSMLPGTNLFIIGLCTPISTFIQIFICLFMYKKVYREIKQPKL